MKKTHEEICLHVLLLILPYLVSFLCEAREAIFEARDLVLSQATSLRFTEPVSTCRRHFNLTTSYIH